MTLLSRCACLLGWLAWFPPSLLAGTPDPQLIAGVEKLFARRVVRGADEIDIGVVEQLRQLPPQRRRQALSPGAARLVPADATELPIKQIAVQTRFRYRQYLTRVFSKAAHQTPARYRKHMRRRPQRLSNPSTARIRCYGSSFRPCQHVGNGTGVDRVWQPVVTREHESGLSSRRSAGGRTFPAGLAPS